MKTPLFLALFSFQPAHEEVYRATRLRKISWVWFQFIVKCFCLEIFSCPRLGVCVCACQVWCFKNIFTLVHHAHLAFFLRPNGAGAQVLFSCSRWVILLWAHTQRNNICSMCYYLYVSTLYRLMCLMVHLAWTARVEKKKNRVNTFINLL